MQIHQVKRNTKNKKRLRVGRGGKRGKTSGKGTKGQKSRAGRKLRPEERDIIKKIPKLRGYRFKSFQPQIIAVNVSKLEHAFNDGDIVSKETLLAKNIIKKTKGRMPEVKILSRGDITKKVIVESLPISATAKEKITKAGGEVK
jgi:large subunit ribosomal protein L15